MLSSNVGVATITMTEIIIIGDVTKDFRSTSKFKQSSSVVVEISDFIGKQCLLHLIINTFSLKNSLTTKCCILQD